MEMPEAVLPNAIVGERYDIEGFVIVVDGGRVGPTCRVMFDEFEWRLGTR